MKPRGLKAHLAMLRAAGVADASFHPDGALASVTFAGGPSLPAAKPKEVSAAAAQKVAESRARIAGELGIDEGQLAEVLGQVPELNGTVS